MRVHVLQHVAFETPGRLIEEIRHRGYSLQTTALYDGAPLPNRSDFDILIIMGGPMSVHDEAEFPWLRPEKELIAKSIREGKKVLGICLGAQLIAEVCGGRVYRASEKEIGWLPVRWMGGLETMEFHWHGETFDLPREAVLLASTKTCVNQAFRLGDNVLALQFHPEVTEELIHAMVDNEGWELKPENSDKQPYVQSAAEIMAGAQQLLKRRGPTGPQPGLADWLKQWL